MEESSTQSRGRVKGQCPLENLQIPLAKRGKCGYNEWECARMGTAQDKPWKASRGGCEPGQDCLMANHPGARFSEATRAKRAQVRRSGKGKTGSPVIEKAGACACTERIGIVPVKLGGTADESQKAFSSVPVHFHAGADFFVCAAAETTRMRCMVCTIRLPRI